MQRLPTLLLLSLALCGAAACANNKSTRDYTWADGTLTRVYTAAAREAHSAVLRTLTADFQFSLYRNNPEEIEAFNRGGQRIQINLTYLSPHAVAVSVHVGQTGNRFLSHRILAHLGRYLGE